MQLVHTPAERQQVPRPRGERRPYGVVAARGLRLDAGERLLVAGVDRRDPRQQRQQRDGVVDVPVVGELARDAGGVVVADEGVRDEVGQHRAVTAERVVELPEVLGLHRAPDGLPQLVLGHGVHPRRGDEVRVVAVDDLAQQPEVGVVRQDGLGDRSPGIGPRRVRRVEPPPVRADLGPVQDDPGHVVGDRRLGEVELHEVVVALEVHRVRPGPPDPAPRLGVRPVLQGPYDDLVVARHVVEDAVQHDAHTLVAARGREVAERLGGAEPRVDGEVVQSVVAVGGRAEDRPQEQPVGAEGDDVVEPLLELGQARYGIGARVGERTLRSGEAERVHVPPDGVERPGRVHDELLRHPQRVMWGSGPRGISTILRLRFAMPSTRLDRVLTGV